MITRSPVLPGRPAAVALAACIAAVFLTLAEPAHAGNVSFQLTPLAMPEGSFASAVARDINNLGQVAGYVGDGIYTPKQAAVWDSSGRLTLLQQPAGAVGSEARAINDFGQAVGQVSYAGDWSNTRAATWMGTGVMLLPDTGRVGAHADDINNSGLIVGSVIGSTGYQHAAAWRYGQLVDLGASTYRGDAFSAANAVNQQGEITGSVDWRSGSISRTPLIWADYATGDFRLYGQWGGIGLNDYGQLLTVETSGDAQSHVIAPVLLGPNGQETRLLPEGMSGWFAHINNAGQAAGQAGGLAALWSPSGGLVTVASRVQAGAPAVTGVDAINELGQMTARTADGRSAILTPSGTLDYTGASGSFFNEASNWDSGMGYAPNRFLDARIGGERDVLGPSFETLVKSVQVGNGQGLTRLVLMEYGRLSTLEGLHVRNGGRLVVAAGSDALYATGHAGGLVHVENGGSIELKAGRAIDGEFDRLEIDGTLRLDGGAFIVTFTGGSPLALGDSFDFLDFGSVQGSFAELLLPALAKGLAWDSSRLYVDGVLSVAAVPEPAGWALWLGGAALLLAARRKMGTGGA